MTILGYVHMLTTIVLWVPGPRHIFWIAATSLLVLSLVLWKFHLRGNIGRRLFSILFGVVFGLIIFERAGTLSRNSDDMRFVTDMIAIRKVKTRDEIKALSLNFDNIKDSGLKMSMYYRYRWFAATLGNDIKSLEIEFDGKGRITKFTSTGRSS